MGLWLDGTLTRGVATRCPGMLERTSGCGGWTGHPQGVSLLDALDNGGDTLSDADTHGCQPVTPVASFQFVEQGDE